MSNETVQKNLGKQHERVAPCPEGFTRFLRNRHPRDTVFWVSSKTGVKSATVEKWLYEKAMPQLRHLGPLMAIYGPDVLAAIFPKGLGWLDAHQREQRARALEARRAAIDAELRELCGD